MSEGRAARILVVEDDEGLRETLAEVLGDEGYEVRVAAHGGKAIEILRQWPADLVLLDLMMPVMDAFEFRERQRGLGHVPAAKVVVFSAASDVDTSASRLGADEWIAKPFGIDDIISVVHRSVRQAG